MPRSQSRHSELWNPSSPSPVDPILVDEPTAAAMLGICPRTLHTLHKEGHVPARTLPQANTRKLFHVDDLRAFAKNLPPYKKPTRCHGEEETK